MTAADELVVEPSRRRRLMTAGKAVLKRPASLIPFLFRRVTEARMMQSAAALSFSTALAVIPALALVLAILAAFPAFNDLRINLQSAIVANLMPDTGLKASEFMGQFIEAAGKVTAFGAIGLALTAILLLLTIEGALNGVLKITKPRRLPQRLLVFWAIMTLGPLLLGAGLSSFGYFARKSIEDGTTTTSPSGMILLGNLLPTVMTWLTLTLIFMLVPHRRIRFKDALAGAAVAALLLTILRYSFAAYVIFMTSYKAIYGALAAVPVFLVWIYLVWMAVMAGAVVTGSLPDWRYARSDVGSGTLGRLSLALQILADLAMARKHGTGMTAEQLGKILGAPDTVTMSVLNDLRTGRFAAPGEDGRWLLTRDLERTTLGDLVHHFDLGLNFSLPEDDSSAGDLAKRVNQYLRNAANSERALLSVSLARVVLPPEDVKPETKEAAR
ncbi:MAG: YihY family inner membrane protein [Rhodospirillaceae bacterium]|nr:YihY family inner membrane protein [Rhodospirillaceae bacterium]